MRSCDVLVIGGGPAGSSAAWRLRQGGADVMVLDRERFPRLKLCAGWITPEVVRDLEIEPADYPHGFLTFTHMRFFVKGIGVRVPCVQHSIRRTEFDAWLLERAAVPVIQHTAREIRALPGGGFEVDGAYRCRYLVGAGGTRCPVYRALFRELSPRVAELQTVTLEHELPYDWRDGDCHLWFFGDGLPGYAWYVPKANGWLNVGIGGMAERMKRSGQDIRHHWSTLGTRLEGGLARGAALDPGGYSYYLRGPVPVPERNGAFLTGDAAGLATRDMAEGIGPAVRSGLRAARSILHGERYALDDVTGASLGGGLASRLFDWAMTRGAGRASGPAASPRGGSVAATS